MAAPSTTRSGQQRMRGLGGQAHALAARLPELMVEARRIAQTVAYGIHGRRRAGPGETFWQFRPMQPGDPRSAVDWRRSASSDRLYLREREWEAAHTVWLWPDLSPSMAFKSHLANGEKRDRALVLAFALAELLVAGGERVGVPGLVEPSASRRSSERIAARIGEVEARGAKFASLPPDRPLARFCEGVVIGDLLEPVEQIEARVRTLAAEGAHGHLVQVLDPAEETLPYEGRVEFLGLEGEGSTITNRADALRSQYADRLAAHRAALSRLASRIEWSFLVHRTDQPPEQALLALHMRLSGGARYDRKPMVPEAAP